MAAALTRTGPRYFLGLSATMHDPAIALLDGDGNVLFAEALERPLQDKRAWNQPPDHMVLVQQLLASHCPPGGRLYVGVSWSRALVQRLRLASAVRLPGLQGSIGRLLGHAFKRRDHLVWPAASYGALLRSLGNAVDQAGVNLAFLGYGSASPMYFDHHLTHAAYACASSPYERALCAVVDGFGERTSTSFYRFDDGALTRLQGTGQGAGPASLGMFYAMVCGLCGFDPVLGEEWKVMGLAPYGRVDGRLYAALRPLLRIDGLRVRQGVSGREYRRRLTQARALVPAGDDVVARADVAATGQHIFAELMTQLLENLHLRGGGDLDAVVLTGGCALNSAFNGQITRRTPFRSLFVPSAPADDGNAIGAAHLARLARTRGGRLPIGQSNPYLGSSISEAAIDRLQRHAGIEVGSADSARVAALLASGRIVGFVHGRAEFGPRALGNRSILADPRDATIGERINRAVKFREGFRPFGPAILDECGSDYFRDYVFSPYMERAFVYHDAVRPRVPAVVHVDGTGRLQSVRADLAPRLHELLWQFRALTGVPILLNTSFNRMGKPIVHAVDDAVAMFMTSDIDVLVIEDKLLLKPCRATTN